MSHNSARNPRLADAEKLSPEIERRAAEHDVGAGIRAMICLATGDHGGAAEWIETAIEEAGRHEIDQGFWPLMNLKMNATADPVLEEPRFVALRDRLRGD